MRCFSAQAQGATNPFRQRSASRSTKANALLTPTLPSPMYKAGVTRPEKRQAEPRLGRDAGDLESPEMIEPKPANTMVHGEANKVTVGHDGPQACVLVVCSVTG